MIQFRVHFDLITFDVYLTALPLWENWIFKKNEHEMISQCYQHVNSNHSYIVYEAYLSTSTTTSTRHKSRIEKEIQMNECMNKLHKIKIIHASGAYTFSKCDRISGLAKRLSVSGGI